MRVAAYAAGDRAVLWALAEGLEQPFSDVASWSTPDLYAGLIRLDAKRLVREYEDYEQKRAQKTAGKFGSSWRK